MAHTGIGGTAEEQQEEEQKRGTETNSMERSNESEYASSDLTLEEQLEKSGKLTKMQKDRIAEYKRIGASLRETAKYMSVPALPSIIISRTFPARLFPRKIRLDLPGLVVSDKADSGRGRGGPKDRARTARGKRVFTTVEGKGS